MECETLIERTWQIHTPFLQHTLPISQKNLALKCEALKPQTFLGVPAVRSAWQPTPLRNMNGWGSLPSLHFLCNFHPSKYQLIELMSLEVTAFLEGRNL